VTRLVLFVLTLAAAFVAAAAVGRAVGPLEREVEPAEHGAGGAEETRFALELLAGPPSLAFRIAGAESFDVMHERRMHLIVVRRDLTGFMHLHPEQRADGAWEVPVPLSAPGTWTAFADFSSGGERATLSFDLHATGSFRARRLPPPATVVRTDGYEVRLDGDVAAGRLEFAVTRGGRPVAVDRYLGARGHLVVLREGDLEYLHVHAEEDELAFETDFPSPGRYRLFLQFEADGAVHTAEFTVQA
jgi:hypothetical protein